MMAKHLNQGRIVAPLLQPIKRVECATCLGEGYVDTFNPFDPCDVYGIECPHCYGMGMIEVGDEAWQVAA